ncbi:hypothetical protein SAMN05661080_01283 [Modestobacter sp. DSM 44400]|uniref:SRPBCC family protein n=1 Tax=Modestobacter sp. DSM 44400 TaxID=1550230 RepID=UPI0008980E88|nr:SRPBCC family protein [Modestobacter sp. DSM 44400]SDX80360.1 hypothetical protein SAMN05661080_01283 [Modestobacter sp. DSM 44400]
MRLTNEVVLPAPPEQVFRLLNDVQRVAPCLPGATLEGASGADAYQGKVKIKVGPITAAYQGTVRFLEVDEAARRLVLDAKGADQHGSGSAEAKVSVAITAHAEGSTLSLDTDLVIRGKVAQFGRGAINEVSQKLMEQFARNLSGLLSEPAPAADGVAPPTAVPTPRPAAGDGAVQPAGTVAGSTDHGSLNALSLVVLPLLRRAAPVVGVLAAALTAVALVRRGGGRGVLLDEVVPAVIRVDGERVQVQVRRRIETLRR